MLNIKTDFLYTEDTQAPFQIVHMGYEQVEELTNEVSRLANILMGPGGTQGVKELYTGNIYSNEEEYGLFLGYYSLLDKFNKKLVKQIENLMSPIMKAQGKDFSELELEDIGTFRFSQKINTALKFDYQASKNFLLKNFYINGTVEEQFLLESFLETTAGFSLSKSGLEKLLKNKGYLEDQIDAGLEKFIFKEVSYRKSMLLPKLGNFDPNIRVMFQVYDFTYNNETNGLYQTNFNTLLQVSNNINAVLQNAKTLYNKAKSIIENGDEPFQGRFITIKTKESSKIKMTGLYQDNQGNKIDVISTFMDMFQLTSDDVREFVNSRKRNIVSMPDGNNILTYEKEDIKFNTYLPSDQ